MATTKNSPPPDLGRSTFYFILDVWGKATLVIMTSREVGGGMREEGEGRGEEGGERRKEGGFVTWNRYQDRSGAGFVTWNRYQDRSGAGFVTWNRYQGRCRCQGRDRDVAEAGLLAVAAICGVDRTESAREDREPHCRNIIIDIYIYIYIYIYLFMYRYIELRPRSSIQTSSLFAWISTLNISMPVQSIAYLKLVWLPWLFPLALPAVAYGPSYSVLNLK